MTCRLLIVAPFAPRINAMHGGSRAIAQLLTELATRHAVGLVYLRAENEPAIDAPVASACEFVSEVARPWRDAGRVSRALRLGLGLAGSTPMWARRWQVHECALELRAAVARWKPAVVQFEFHVMGQYAEALDGLPPRRVLVQHEPGTMAAAERLALARGLRRPLAAADHRAWVRYERRIAQHFHRVVTFTARDAEHVRELAPEIPVSCIPLGIAAAPVRGSPPCDNRQTLIFVGSYEHPPNEEAAIRLARRILPLVRRTHPDVVLRLVGHAPTAAVEALRGPHVEVVGSPPDVSPYLEGATVFVAPLMSGGGMRVKVLEALAAGKPIVCSSRAIDGIAVRHRQHVRVAAGDAEFADEISGLLDAPAAREALGTAGRDWVRCHATIAQTAAQYEQLYAHLCAPGPETPDGLAIDARPRIAITHR